LESAKPLSDGVDEREEDKGIVVPFPTMDWFTATTLSLLLNQTNNWLYKKRDKKE
jgi:hypothetical protein